MCVHSVAKTNIFNVDETGFILCVAGTERILVPAGDPSCRFKAQQGSWEWVTVVECIGSGGQVLAPLMITKRQHHVVGDYRQMEGVPTLWNFTESLNGWSKDELAVEWLGTIFMPNTRPSTPSQLASPHHRLPSIIHDYVIHCINMVETYHSSPTSGTYNARNAARNVSIFGPVRGSYRQLVADAAKHVDAINRSDFATF